MGRDGAKLILLLDEPFGSLINIKFRLHKKFSIFLNVGRFFAARSAFVYQIYKQNRSVKIPLINGKTKIGRFLEKKKNRQPLFKDDFSLRSLSNNVKIKNVLWQLGTVSASH